MLTGIIKELPGKDALIIYDFDHFTQFFIPPSHEKTDVNPLLEIFRRMFKIITYSSLSMEQRDMVNAPIVIELSQLLHTDSKFFIRRIRNNRIFKKHDEALRIINMLRMDLEKGNKRDYIYLMNKEFKKIKEINEKYLDKKTRLLKYV
jgi:hypothetical protein